jgi:hypothetical protein
VAPTQVLKVFRRVVTLGGLQAPAGSYERLWAPLLTLWYLIWQCLQPKHTLEAVVTDARRGGADRLCARGKPLSGRIKSKATTVDQAVVWSASPHDQIDPGLSQASVAGRLIIIQAQPRGYRPQTLYLFTTLTDVQAYPPKGWTR